MKLFIKEVLVLDKFSPHNGNTCNLIIEDDQIIDVTENLAIPEGFEVFDGKGLKISQGWVDVGTHYKDPGFEWLDDLVSISEAAAFGGYTHLVGFPNTEPVVQTKEALSYFQNFSKRNAVQLHNLAAITKNCEGKDFTDMIDLKKAGARGFSDGKKAIQSSDIFLKTLLYLQSLETVLVVKSEDKYLSMFGQMHEGISSTMLGLKGIPSAGEELMIMRNLKLLEYSGISSESSILHFSTISTKGAIQLIREAKAKGMAVSCDVTAQHLVFRDADLVGFDTNFKVYPPFRADEDVLAIKAGLEDGTIDFIVSDHDSWDQEHKTLEFGAAEFGAIGLQTVFPIALEHLGLERLLEKMVYNPRKIFRIENNPLKKGSKVDFTIFSDLEEYILNESFIKSKGKNSPFLGQKLKGRAKAIYNNGIFEILN